MGYAQAMLAGAAAGISEHLFMFPVDTVKTRLQVIGVPGMPIYRGVLHAFNSIVRREGIAHLYKGLPAILLGAVPSHAAYFATYEFVKDHIGGRAPGHHPLINGFAGACAVMAHDAIVTPLDVVKQRMQVYKSQHNTIVSCVRSIVRQEGAGVLFASYPVTVAMNVPFMAVHFATYESVKLHLTDHMHCPSITSHLMAGAAAGALGGFVSTPFDVVKTRIQVNGDTSGLRHVLATIAEREGYRALFQGAIARCMYFTPSAAICWTTYEAFKAWLA